MKLLFPDACWNKDLISGALFLYFYDEGIAFTLHPSVSTFLTGIDPFDFMRFVDSNRPGWLPKFFKFVQLWTAYRSSLQETSELLEPLRGTGFTTILMSYPRGSGAWQSAQNLLDSSELDIPSITKLIDPFSASDELFSHIFFERYLELYEGHRTTEELIALGAEEARSVPNDEPVKVDWDPLFKYCDTIFKATEIGTILTTAYMFRLQILQDVPAVLLTNPQLVDFLSSLPVDATGARRERPNDIDFDVIAWEFFRQLVSPRTDPLNQETIKEVAQIIQDRSSEIEALKRRCLRLAQDLGAETDLQALQKRISQHIRANVEGEIRDLLSINKKATQEFLDSVLSDEKSWIGIATFLYSFVHGGSIITAGAAIYALASLGSKAFKATADRRDKLKMNDFRLIYRMRE